MKYAVYMLLAMLLILLSSCSDNKQPSEDSVSTEPQTTIEEQFTDDEESTENETTTEEQLVLAEYGPPNYDYPITYELRGYPPEYKQSNIERNTETIYSITYVNDESNLIAYEPVSSIDELDEDKDSLLRDYGTYEALVNNELISNIRTSTDETEYGTKTVYTYDTRSHQDLVDTYIELYNSDNDTKYIVVESFAEDSLMHALIFAYNDTAPFLCFCFGKSLTPDEIMNLYSAKVDE